PGSCARRGAARGASPGRGAVRLGGLVGRGARLPAAGAHTIAGAHGGPMRLGPLLLAVALAAGAPGTPPPCAPGPRDVMRIAPRMDPEMARHLARDDETAFRRYCRNAGAVDIRGAITWLLAGLDSRSADRYARSWGRAAPYLERLGWAMDTEFDCPEY